MKIVLGRSPRKPQSLLVLAKPKHPGRSCPHFFNLHDITTSQIATRKKIPIDADSKMRTLSNWSQITSKRLVIRNCLKAFKNRRRRLILHPQKLKRYVGKSNDSFQNFVNKGIHRPGSGISFTKLVSEK